MLRRRSSAVAKNSQHMLGKAIDFHLPDVSVDRIRAVGMRLQNGGVGYYPSSYTPFVHLDVGSVRAWPRMTRAQLVRLFPNGKTVHIPADGEPLPRYEEARAEILARGGTVAGYTAFANAGSIPEAQPRRKSFWATLFGWDDEDEDAEEIRRSRTPTMLARRSPGPAPAAEPVEEEEIAPTVTASRSSAPVQLASVAPPSRISSSSGAETRERPSQVAWQPGGTMAVTRDRTVSVARDIALAPIPPRRPEDITATGALAFAAAPPTRPVRDGTAGLVAALPIKTEPEAMTALHPLPPRRPDPRPAAVAALSPPRTEGTRVTAVTPKPIPIRPAKQEVTRDNATPAVAPASQRIHPKHEPLPEIPRTDRGQLNSLFSAALMTEPSTTKGFVNGPASALPTRQFSKRAAPR
jgi:hypothetical protein